MNNEPSEITQLRREVESLRREVEMLKMRFKKRDDVIQEILTKTERFI